MLPSPSPALVCARRRRRNNTQVVGRTPGTSTDSSKSLCHWVVPGKWEATERRTRYRGDGRGNGAGTPYFLSWHLGGVRLHWFKRPVTSLASFLEAVALRGDVPCCQNGEIARLFQLPSKPPSRGVGNTSGSMGKAPLWHPLWKGTFSILHQLKTTRKLLVCHDSITPSARCPSSVQTAVTLQIMINIEVAASDLCQFVIRQSAALRTPTTLGLQRSTDDNQASNVLPSMLHRWRAVLGHDDTVTLKWRCPGWRPSWQYLMPTNSSTCVVSCSFHAVH
ncbi:hypothetical protein N657DRAFT_313029 [Parathielavia appendiculata]|uniref:Uncharacterized protein n=1 Tax=Parathielavia appendiculata TaxID=2587402 RepID=A0AAN6Z678_9PEZI|nr:hypothetical protein N657DRAFT_313029 [Parathielavia appendiculata]